VSIWAMVWKRGTGETGEKWKAVQTKRPTDATLKRVHSNKQKLWQHKIQSDACVV
jgi:hypothetical protein